MWEWQRARRLNVEVLVGAGWLDREYGEWGIRISVVNKSEKSVRVTKAGIPGSDHPVFAEVGDFESPVPPHDVRAYLVRSDNYLRAANPFEPITGFVELFDRRRLASQPKLLIDQMAILEAVQRLGRPVAGEDFETRKEVLMMYARIVEDEWAAASV